MSDTDPPTPTQQPDDPPAAVPPRAPRRGFSRRTKLVAAAVALVVLAGGGVATWTALSSGPQYQKVSSAGSDPFMDPIGQDQPNITPVADAGPLQSGDTRGMFAQDPAHPACDPAALTSNLQGDPAKATAWAQVLGITPEIIPQFVNSLTPVVLRSDTGVTDHGYSGGTFTSTPATLAAGTAVLTNSYGEPTVKCFTGDPLMR